MRAIVPKLSGSLLILVIICFFLPFISISCDHRPVVQLSGIQLVTGAKVEQPGLLWRESRAVPPQLWATISFGLAVAGVILSLWQKGRFGGILQAIVSSVAALALLLLKAKLQDDALHYPKLVFYVEYLPCYWIAVGLFAVVAVVNIGGWFWLKRK